ncbi:MAG: rhamnulokinase family protein [Planctomycetota bacterium]
MFLNSSIWSRQWAEILVKFRNKSIQNGKKKKESQFLAFDLGAESGRALLGTLQDRQLKVEELHRFPNIPVNIHSHIYWNIFRIYENLKESLKICALQRKLSPHSIGVDTWGVDYALLADDGNILGLPYTYRDIRTEGVIEAFFEKFSSEHTYELTGIQVYRINTIFQLYSMVRDKSPLLKVAKDLLFTPDLLLYLLTGEKKTEFSIATTSGLFNPVTNSWEPELFEALEIPIDIMQEVVAPGTITGNLTSEILKETGIDTIPAVAPATHDTGSAVAAVPAEGEDWAYISSGTWSLMGIEIRKPVLTHEARKRNFTNEGGVDGTFRFLKNIVGLWLLQKCVWKWSKTHDVSYAKLTREAVSAKPFKALINPDYDGFLNPPDMPEAITAFCKHTKQPIPRSSSEITRSILESLALRYRAVLDELRQVSSVPINKIHVIGGGSKNHLLCQFTANATGLPVIAGPVEATAIGNLLVQAKTLGYISSIAELRNIVRNSFSVTMFKPKDADLWEKAYERFCNISNRL